MGLEELLQRVVRDGEESALAWMLERDDAPPLAWLPIESRRLRVPALGGVL